MLTQDNLKGWADISSKLRQQYRQDAFSAGFLGKDAEEREDFELSSLAKGIEITNTVTVGDSISNWELIPALRRQLAFGDGGSILLRSRRCSN